MSNDFRYKSITEKDSREERLAKFFRMELVKLDEQALKDILKSKNGRWFLMRLLDATKINQSCFTGNSTTFYNEGRRDVGLEIMGRISGMGIEALKLKQKAEMEYVEHQLKARELALEYIEENRKE